MSVEGWRTVDTATITERVGEPAAATGRRSDARVRYGSAYQGAGLSVRKAPRGSTRPSPRGSTRADRIGAASFLQHQRVEPRTPYSTRHFCGQVALFAAAITIGPFALVAALRLMVLAIGGQ